MKLNVGFTLIELLVSIAIASLVGIALFSAFDLINRYVVVVDNTTDMALRLHTLRQHLERDLSGVFVPVAAQVEQKSTTTLEQQASPLQQPAGKEKAVPAQPKETPKPIDKVFYGTHKDTNFATFSFITSNPLQIYWSKQAGKAKPRIARVIYRLIPDNESKKSYHLTRQEGTDLHFETYKPGSSKAVRDYTMIEGIKNLDIEYLAEKEEAISDKRTQEKKIKKEYKTVKEWKVDSKEQKNGKSLIPNGIVLKGALWDNQQQGYTQFEFKLMLNNKAESPPEIKPQKLVNAWDLVQRFPPHLAQLFQPPQQQAAPAKVTQKAHANTMYETNYQMKGRQNTTVTPGKPMNEQEWMALQKNTMPLAQGNIHAKNLLTK